MFKVAIISAYIIHKIYWKQTNKEVTIAWKNFF